MKREQTGQKEIQNVVFKGKKRTKELNVAVKACAERYKDIRAYKDRLTQHWKKGKGVLRERPYQTNNPACKKKG